MSAKTNDTLYLAVGGLAILGTGVWAFLQQSDIKAFRSPANAPASGSAYEATAITITSPESRKWADAQSQTAGEKWIYDVFTPPEIYYNTRTKQFTVVPPVIEPTAVTNTGDPVPVLPPSFGLELVKVEQPLFRLQLEGWVGEGPSARGNFLNVQTGTAVFGTTGKKLPDLNLEIVRFSAERRVTEIPGGTRIVETVATAVVRDTVTGVETPLDAKVRTPEGPLSVTFKLADGTERSAKSGESISAGDHTFKVGELTLDPPSAVVIKEGKDLAVPETKTLVIPPPPPPAPVVDPNAPPSEAMDAPQPGTPGAFPGF